MGFIDALNKLMGREGGAEKLYKEIKTFTLWANNNFPMWDEEHDNGEAMWRILRQRALNGEF